MFKDLPKDLIKAVAEINQKSHEAYVVEQAAIAAKKSAKQMKMPGVPAPEADPAAHADAASMAKKNVKEEAEGTTPKTAEHKKLAALRPPFNKITHGDVLHGRGVRKEEIEQADEAMSPQAKTTMKHIPNPTPDMKKAAKDIKPGVSGYRDRIAMLKAGGVKEEAEAKKPNAFDYKTPRKPEDMPNRKSGDVTMTGHDVKKISTGTVYTKRFTKEAMDTPGNSTHQCAIHVKSEQFGEGRTLTSQHAEPDTDGNIAWYDVMFAEGIKRVETKDIEVLVSEGHMNHKKKKM